MEGMRAPWVKRFHEETLGGLRMKVEVTDEELVLTKLGKRRSASLEDEDGMWKILTNDMELNEETEMKVLENIPHLNIASHQ